MDSREVLYLAPEDLYRLGNATSPLLTRLRPGEVDIFDENGVKMIVANRKGVSLYNKVGLDLVPLTGWVWEIKARTSLPLGLMLIPDGNPVGHFTLCPCKNMPVQEFVDLLEKTVFFCKKVFKKAA